MNRFLFCLILLLPLATIGQELNCKVIINADQIQTQDRRVFEDMETTFTQFVNDRKWTDDEFLLEERISCNIILTLNPKDTDPAAGRFQAKVQILASRPVFGTDYQTVTLNFADVDWVFDYLPSQPLQFNENSFTNNITSLLAFYAYMVLALDYDSFSELGGTGYLQTANTIMINAQSSNFPGWTQFNSVKSRYWLVENLMSASFEPLRKAYYTYHMKGLDIFNEKPDEARANILEAIKGLQSASNSRPRAIASISFLDAKTEEIIRIFKEGSPTEKKEVYEILRRIDPARTDDFKKILD